MKYKSGFTLVEVIIVVVILSIIAGISVVAFNTQQRVARDNNLETTAAQLATAMDRYYEENGSYPVTCNIGSHPTLSCGSLGDTYKTGTTQPPTITASTTTAQLKTILPALTEEISHPKNTSQTIINQQSSGAIKRDSYFLLSMDMVPGADAFIITPIDPTPIDPKDPSPCVPSIFAPCADSDPKTTTSTSGQSSSTLLANTTSDIKVLAANTTPEEATVTFQSGSGNFTCSFDLTGRNQANQEDTRPHQYIVGFFTEEQNAWQFYISPQTPDQNVLNWNKTSDARCNTKPVGELKNASLS